MATYVAGSITAGSVTINPTNGITFNGTLSGGWTSLGPLTTVSSTTTTIPSTYLDQDRVWSRWTDVGYGTGFEVAYYNQPVWDAWVEDDEQRIARLAAEQLMRDELQARREQDSRERLAREQERMENQLAAHARALELLDDLLTEDERELRRAENRVAVRGSDGHLYWIEMHRETVHGNIVRTDEHGCSLGRACVAPRMYDVNEALPTPDGWVGQYLGLKFDATEFLSHANWSGIRDCVAQEAA